ncbi:hypothetical protein [Aliikangiella sp. IMCC44632]
MMNQHDFNGLALADKGLLLQAVFNLDQLPPPMVKELRENKTYSHYQQALLLGNVGGRLWELFNQAISSPQGSEQQLKYSDDPFDRFSANLIESHLKHYYPKLKFLRLYPGFNQESQVSVGLQQLGKLAGWHYDSPLKVGINSLYGTWFAYRGLYLIEGGFCVTKPLQATSPCETCKTKLCISACAGNALESGALNLNQCIDYRSQKASRCEQTCEARLACPIASAYRYSSQQLSFHYGQSIKLIKSFKV